MRRSPRTTAGDHHDRAGTEASGAAEHPLRRPDTKATLLRFKAAGGTSLDGVMVGSMESPQEQIIILTPLFAGKNRPDALR